MPYELLERNGKHCVAKKSGEVLKCYASKDQATAYLRALYANVTAAGYDESKHPRYPKGDPHGGEFAPKDGDSSASAQRQAENAAAKKQEIESTPPDTAQQKAALRNSAAARKVREKFPVGTRVFSHKGDKVPIQYGTVTRHVPGQDAQGGYLVVRWDNGNTGRQRAMTLAKDDSLTAAGMPAHEFNGRFQVGQRLAARHEPDLMRKYESAFRAQGTKSRKKIGALTAAVDPNIPEGIIDETAFKDSVTKRTAAARKKMVNEVMVSLLGEQAVKAASEEIGVLISKIATVQAENAFLAAEDAVHSAILDGLTQGLSVDQTADKIGEVMDEWAPWQAQRQAQTDLVSLSNGASLTAARILGPDAPQFKTWLSAGDDRVRPAHVFLDRKTVPIEEPWEYEGAQIMYPGDPAAPDGLYINCRCTQIYTDTQTASLAHSLNGGIIEDPLGLAAAGNPYHEPKGTHIGGRFAHRQGSPVTLTEGSKEETLNGAAELQRILAPGATGESINVYWDPTPDEYNPNGQWVMRPFEERRVFSPDEPHISQDTWPATYVTWKEAHGDTPIMQDTSPPNPKVGGLDDSMKRWILGRKKQDGFPWFREMRADYAAQMGLPLPEEVDSSGHYLRAADAPSFEETRKATTSLIKGLEAAPPSQPGLWRGLGAASENEWTRTVANAAPGDTLRMLPASWSRDANVATVYATTGSPEPGVVIYAQPGSRGINDSKKLLSDQEVVTAGEFKIISVDDVEIPDIDPRWGTAKYRVVTVNQIEPGEVITSSAWTEGMQAAGFDPTKHPRAPHGVREGGRFVAVSNGVGNYAVVDDHTGEEIASNINSAQDAIDLADLKNVTTGEASSVPSANLENVTRLGTMHGTTNPVYSALQDGRQVVVKPEIQITPMQLRGGITPGFDLPREEAAYRVAERIRSYDPEMAVNTPRYRIMADDRPGGFGVVGVSDYVEGDIIADSNKDLSHAYNESFFDSVIGNTDRNLGNAIVAPDGTLHLIDHGLAFPEDSKSSFDYEFGTEGRAGNRGLFPKEREVLSRMMMDRATIDQEDLDGLPSEARDEFWNRMDGMLEYEELM